MSEEVNVGKDGLNGVKLVKEDKESGDESICRLNDLKRGEEEGFNEEIKNGGRRGEVEEMIGEGDVLNKMMKGLENSM
ncbi:hypothetical protein, partial [Staphylococcus capitis]|uniref:hypothetical protein n=1 Tax=Staphylococcus capitis TaxID=29388 RepID=UPI00119CE541